MDSETQFQLYVAPYKGSQGATAATARNTGANPFYFR